jgi:hypothetical protein
MNDNTRKVLTLWNALDEVQIKLDSVILPLLRFLGSEDTQNEELAQTLSLADEAIRRHLESRTLNLGIRRLPELRTR